MDINADLGESYGNWKLGDDERLVTYITSANLACGFHAGDFNVMDRTVRLCQRAGVAIGAQPGYPDLLGFGRRAMQFEPDEIERLVLYQLGALHAFTRGNRASLEHVKPHGALYNQAAVTPELAQAVARAVRRFSRRLPLVGLAGSLPFIEAAADAGLDFVPEGFIDRRYRSDGTLVPRTEPDAVIRDPAEAARQATRIALHGEVVTEDGETIRIEAASLCLHGDTPEAVEILANVRSQLELAGVHVAPIRIRTGIWE